MIKPIETIYNGYRFRSRLEARWAVFFDAAHIKYEYEPDGFDLDGEYYLPDFYLSDFDLYVEIKPFDGNIVKHVGDGNEWERKCEKFRDKTDKPILLCYGDPAESVYNLLFAWAVNDSGGGYSEWNAMFTDNPSGQNVVLMIENYKDYDVRWNLCMKERSPRVIMASSDEEWSEYAMRIDVSSYLEESACARAQIAGRQARFEHGEKPQI